jgi:DNA-binding beta-propeller fold protein YncE
MGCMAIEPGQIIGPYKILGKLGEGGMGAVYRAEQPSVHRSVAVKVLTANFADDPGALDRFRREVDIIAQLEHPHILPVYDFGEVGGSPYIVMRFMGGGSLLDWLRDGSLPLARTLDILDQIAQALDFAHDRDVIHRDLKPANVLLDEAGNAYLADFGLAKTMGGTRDLTQTGTIMGTPAYMSPEQARGDKLDARSDVYSFAVVAYHALAGQLPFTAGSAMEYIQKHLTEAPASIRNAVPEYPPAVDGVLGAAMAKAREARPARAGELMKSLRAALSGAVAAPAPLPVTPAAAGATRHTPTVMDRPSAAPAPATAATMMAPPAARVRRGGLGWLAAAAGLLTVGGVALVAVVVVVVLLLRGGGPRVSNYPVGDSPRALLAADSRLWVANFFENSLSVLDVEGCLAAAATCGATRATYPVADLPTALAFDGERLWVASALNRTLSELDAATGGVRATYSLPHVPSAMVLAGGELWLTNDIAGTVTRVGLDGSVVATYTVGAGPVALADDGEMLWVANQGDGTVVGLSLENGAALKTFAVGGQPSALAFDGQRLWVALRDESAVITLDRQSGAEVARVAVGAGPAALLFDGRTLWSAGQAANSVTRVDAGAARVLSTVRVPGGPYALAWTMCGSGCGDLWVAGEAGDTVSRVRVQD